MSWQQIVSLDTLRKSGKYVCQFDNNRLLVCYLDGDIFVIENRCPHMDVPLDRGEFLASKVIRCNAHGIEFKLDSGEAQGPLAGTLCGLKKYQHCIKNNWVFVNL